MNDDHSSTQISINSTRDACVLPTQKERTFLSQEPQQKRLLRDRRRPSDPSSNTASVLQRANKKGEIYLVRSGKLNGNFLPLPDCSYKLASLP